MGQKKIYRKTKRSQQVGFQKVMFVELATSHPRFIDPRNSFPSKQVFLSTIPATQNIFRKRENYRIDKGTLGLNILNGRVVTSLTHTTL